MGEMYKVRLINLHANGRYLDPINILAHAPVLNDDSRVVIGKYVFINFN